MAFVAIVGSGPIGGAVAHKLALRNRVAEVRLIDEQGSIARGKALDMLQSAPIESFATRITAADSPDASAGAAAIVIADAAAGTGEHAGETGLALLRRITASGLTAPIVVAGASARELMGRGVTELKISPTRIIGSAPLALESALRALAGVAIDGSGVDVGLRLVGVPPGSAVVAWEEASVRGEPLTAQIPAHVLAGLSARIPGLWPPGPYALGAAAARLVEALVNGTRRRLTGFVVMDAGPVRASVAAMPVELERGGIRRVLEPALTRQERTLLENALEK